MAKVTEKNTVKTAPKTAASERKASAKTAAGSADRAAGSGTSASGGKTVTYQKYSGGNPELDSALKVQSDRYYAARAEGDAAGMRDANDRANQIRNQYGYAAEFANEDIAKVAAQSGRGSGGGSGGAGGYSAPDSPRLSGPTDYSDYIREMNRAQQEAALAALQSAYERNVAALDRAEAEIAPAYERSRNQAAGDSALAGRRFAEYAAAQGLNAGAGGQAQLARQNTLQGDLAALRQAEADKRSDLALQRSQAQAEYNSAIAQARAQGDYSLASQLYQEKVRLDQALAQMELQQAQLDQQSWQTGYQLYRDQIADSRYADELAYDRAQDQAALERQQEQERYERQTAQEREQYERDVQRAQLLAGVGDFSGYSALWGLSDAQTAALVSDYAARQQTSRQEAARELAAFYAEYGDFSGLKALGVDTSYVTQMQSYELADQRRKAAQAASKGSSGSKSSGSGSSGRSSGSGGGSQDYQGLFQAALASGHPKSFIANNYKKYGFTSSSGLYDDFGDWEYEQSRQVPSLSTYQEAAAYLRGQGAPVSGLMTASEWARHKSSGRDTSGAGAYATYQDYLNGYVKGAVG